MDYFLFPICKLGHSIHALVIRLSLVPLNPTAFDPDFFGHPREPVMAAMFAEFEVSYAFDLGSCFLAAMMPL